MAGEAQHYVCVTFRNFKAFPQYSVSLRAFNVLVGPNNAGKSTVIGAFRILSEGMRRAASRRPEYLGQLHTWGYRVALEGLPLATENVFYNYDDARPASVRFRLSGGNHLDLIFPAVGQCYMVCGTTGRQVSSPAGFAREYNANLAFVPVLGPVEHEEPLYQKEAARRARLSHRASRNFRNIWYHFPEDFQAFQALVQDTWQGMAIREPEVVARTGGPLLFMFCEEDRIARELFWAGFGFQVWCQMLTYIVQGKHAAMLIIDEPDIYLHSERQRQLLGILRSLGPDILIATHSTEMISEADVEDLLVMNREGQSARRIRDPSQLQGVFGILGSSLNPTLTQLAKSRRALFVEGKDFRILSGIARKLGYSRVASQSDFAVIPVEGYNAIRAIDYAKGMEKALGSRILKGVVFDRDYRSAAEVEDVRRDLAQECSLAWIHDRKELENYLLHPGAIQRAVERKIAERNRRTGECLGLTGEVSQMLLEITDPLKAEVMGQYTAKRAGYERTKRPRVDYATINAEVMGECETLWSNLSDRLTIVPGKRVLAALNQRLQQMCKVTPSALAIVDAMVRDELPPRLIELVRRLDAFAAQEPPG